MALCGTATGTCRATDVGRAAEIPRSQTREATSIAPTTQRNRRRYRGCCRQRRTQFSLVSSLSRHPSVSLHCSLSTPPLSSLSLRSRFISRHFTDRMLVHDRHHTSIQNTVRLYRMQRLPSPHILFLSRPSSSLLLASLLEVEGQRVHGMRRVEKLRVLRPLSGGEEPPPPTALAALELGIRQRHMPAFEVAQTG
jgi:hypothetical protein